MRTVAVVAVAASLLVACSADGNDVASDTTRLNSTSATAPTTSPPTTPPSTFTATTAPSTTPATTTAPSTTARGTAPATTTPTPDAALAEIETRLAEWTEAEGLNGAGLVLVDRDDGIVGEAYVGEFGPDRVSLIASSSKMLTASVVLKLAGDGVIDLDRPLAEQVDWDGDNPDITPAQLISHASGLVGLMPEPAYAPYLCQFLPEGDITDCAATIFGTPDDNADVAPPATEFRYGGGQWQVAGGAAVELSSKGWDELLDETFRTPCGMTSLGYGNHWAEFGAMFAYPHEQFGADPATLTDTDNPNMEGGAYITPRDYGKALLLHLRGGTCDGTQVIAPEMIDRAHTDYFADLDVANAPAYGSGWFHDAESGELHDPGAFGAVGWLDLDGGTGGYLVIEASTSNSMPADLDTLIDEYLATFE